MLNFFKGITEQPQNCGNIATAWKMLVNAEWDAVPRKLCHYFCFFLLILSELNANLVYIPLYQWKKNSTVNLSQKHIILFRVIFHEFVACVYFLLRMRT